MKGIKILFWIPYPVGYAPSQRFRFEQYLELLSRKGCEVKIISFWDEPAWKILYQKGKTHKKIMGFARGLFRRTRSLFEVRKYSFVFIHREATPLGPPVFEWLVHLMGKKIIYDFDDAIWLGNTSAENKIVSHLKWHGKVASICRWSYKVSAGNPYLCEYASKYNENVNLNPTTIDTDRSARPSTNRNTNETITIGWTGTHSTLRYLELLNPALLQLYQQAKLKFRLLVIANKKPAFEAPFLQFICWTKENEIQDLLKIDIGVMPLTDDVWTNGKCGFKALQFMSLEIPTIVSPVGVNQQIVEHEANGFFANNTQEWMLYLERLILNKNLRLEIGKKARQRVVENYSVAANSENFLSLWT